MAAPAAARNFLAGLATGAAAAAFNFKLDPGSPRWAPALVLTLFAISFAAARPLAAWVCSAGVALGAFIALLFDPSLASLEFALVAGAPAWIIGGLSGRLFKGLWFPGIIAALPAVAGAALLVLSPVRASHQRKVRMQRNEETVLNRLKSLRKAELAFAANTPDHHYTCDGPELVAADWFTRPESGSTSKEWLLENGYFLHLECSGAAKSVAFRIIAYPARRGETGEHAFCIGRSGAVQTVDRLEEITCTE